VRPAKDRTCKHGVGPAPRGAASGRPRRDPLGAVARAATSSLAGEIRAVLLLIVHFTCITAIYAEDDPADFIRDTIVKIQAGEYNAVLFEKRRWEFVNWSRAKTFVDDKKHVVHLAKELKDCVEGIPDAQLKAIGYHFVAGMYDYMRLRYDDPIVYGSLAFQSMKNAFDTNKRDVEIVLSYAGIIEDFATRNFFQRALIAFSLGISLTKEGKRAYEAMEYFVKRYSREEINAYMKTVERGELFMALYKKMKKYR
jgi:hypothetical protein